MEEINQPKKLNKTLLILCRLSLVSVILSLLSSVSNLLKGPDTVEQLERQFIGISKAMDAFGNSPEVAFFKENLYQRMLIINSSYSKFWAFSLITQIVGLFGVLLMLRLNKNGFHFYICYSILTISFTYFIVPLKLVMPLEIVFNALFTGFWVFLYARQLKRMN
jgi:hypothetical protein